jgi:hypothetical protein
MANRAYVSAWAQEYSEATQLEKLERLLETAPLSASWPGFTGVVTRALDPTETPVREWDLRSQPVGAAELVSLLRELPGADLAYEIRALWDLWVYEAETGGWKNKPQDLQIDCYGLQYDTGQSGEQEHFLIDLGLEHLFTGHAGLLAGNRGSRIAPAHPEEERFLAAMADPDRLREYHQRTRENIEVLFRWMQEAEAAVPLEKYRMWSEGEENFEATVDQILAVR